MPQPRRDTAAMNQERISRHQVILCFEQVGWTAAEPPDLGEDLIISVYLNGVASGVTFFCQVKSVTNLAHRARRNYLPYSFETKDLKHWSGFALPVVLLIWDINLREGRWIFADTAISDLDTHSLGWRNQDTVTVHIPLLNTTDTVGLETLKSRIGSRLFPIISKGRPLEIHLELQFFNTTEGQAHLEAFERCIKEGEQVELVGDNIKVLSFSDWWQPWTVPTNPSTMRIILGPRELRHQLYAVVEVTSLQGHSASLPNIELSATKVGMEVMTLATLPQESPVHLEVTLNRRLKPSNLHLSVSNENTEVDLNETMKLINFFQAMSEGGQLSLTILGIPGKLFISNFLPSNDWNLDPKYVRLVQLLWMIQNKTGTILRIPPEGLYAADVSAIEELTQIINNGKTVSHAVSGTLTVESTDLDKVLPILVPNGDLYSKQPFGDSYVDLLGLKISTGPMIRQLSAKLAISPGELEDFSKANPGKPIPLHMKDMEITDIYTNWIPQNDNSINDPFPPLIEAKP